MKKKLGRVLAFAVLLRTDIAATRCPLCRVAETDVCSMHALREGQKIEDIYKKYYV